MKQPHIQLDESLNVRYAILPGDPARLDRIAQQLEGVRELAALGFSCVVLSRERIENNLWNYDYEGGTNVVDVYVGYLRKKIDTGFSKKLIHTVWGTGWVLRED